jgi:hypothetical protein
MNTLNSTEPHYIRCVKPNPIKSPSTFMAPMCLEQVLLLPFLGFCAVCSPTRASQLRYSGVFEAVAIRKQGYPFRLTHPIFLERYPHLSLFVLFALVCHRLLSLHSYKCILPDPEAKFSSAKEGCAQIVKEMKLNKENVRRSRCMPETDRCSCLYRYKWAPRWFSTALRSTSRSSCSTASRSDLFALLDVGSTGWLRILLLVVMRVSVMLSP